MLTLHRIRFNAQKLLYVVIIICSISYFIQHIKLEHLYSIFFQRSRILTLGGFCCTKVSQKRVQERDQLAIKMLINTRDSNNYVSVIEFESVAHALASSLYSLRLSATSRRVLSRSVGNHVAPQFFPTSFAGSASRRRRRANGVLSAAQETQGIR